jgi:branched-subunit amino acid transport protein AzlD
VQEWRDYFIFTGSIGATLLGLLFVSMSLNAETILSASHRHLRELAGQTYQSFILVVLVSLFFLFPGLNRAWNYALFGILGAYGICWVAYRLFIVLKMRNPEHQWVRAVRRMLPAAIACLLLIYAGFWASRSDAGSVLAALGSASILLLLSAAAASWDLLVKVAEYRQRR